MTSFLTDPTSIPLKVLTTTQDEGTKPPSKAKEKDDVRKGVACGRQFKVDEKAKEHVSIPFKVLLSEGTHFPTRIVASPSLTSFSTLVTSAPMAIPGRQSPKQVQTEGGNEQNREDDDETLIIGSPPV